MTILKMNRKELEKRIGKVDSKVEELITDMGTPIEYTNDTEIAVEIFPNRPDLLSLQNFARAVYQYKGKGRLASFKVNKPEKDYEVTVDKSVKEVWPHTACAIVKGLKLDDERIKEVIDIQEKLTNSIGRKRRKLGIGLYPLEEIKLPITYTAKDPKEIKFQPLQFDKEINGKQVLTKHPTGIEFAHLVKDWQVYPVFIDANNETLSMPPIINSHKTGRIIESTKDVFIECTGNNIHYIQKALNILLATLSEMNGKIYAMKIKDKKEGNFETPDLSYSEIEFSIESVNKTIGIELKEKEIKRSLERMGIGYKSEKGKSIALIPPYRTDILHWIDLVEEIAIAHGYKNLEPIIPQISTIAEESKESKAKKMIGNILSGIGLIEVSTFHLTTKKDIKKIYFDTPVDELIEVEDSKTIRDTLRQDLLTNIMQVFSENSDSQYPQKIFEIGTTFGRDDSEETRIKESEKLGIALVDEQISFTEIRQILDYLMRMLGVEYHLEINDNHPAFITGRSGDIIVNDKNIGSIGELAPRVLKNWKVNAPGVALEINLESIIHNLYK